ncbi:MAG: hypothetical protein RLZZ396_2841, partial [Planctomycetota bacterium]
QGVALGYLIEPRWGEGLDRTPLAVVDTRSV